MRAGLRHLQGRYSETDELLAGVTREPASPALQRVVQAATGQRIHALTAVNRLDEAQKLVAELSRGEPTAGLDVDTMDALLDARRSAADASLQLPPGSYELVVPSDPNTVALETLPEDLEAAMAQLRRTRERAREDYGRLFNTVLLALHHGHQGSAAVLCTVLSRWAAELGRLRGLCQRHRAAPARPLAAGFSQEAVKSRLLSFRDARASGFPGWQSVAGLRPGEQQDLPAPRASCARRRSWGEGGLRSRLGPRFSPACPCHPESGSCGKVILVSRRTREEDRQGPPCQPAITSANFLVALPLATTDAFSRDSTHRVARLPSRS